MPYIESEEPQLPNVPGANILVLKVLPIFSQLFPLARQSVTIRGPEPQTDVIMLSVCFSVEWAKMM